MVNDSMGKQFKIKIITLNYSEILGKGTMYCATSKFLAGHCDFHKYFDLKVVYLNYLSVFTFAKIPFSEQNLLPMMVTIFLY